MRFSIPKNLNSTASSGILALLKNRISEKEIEIDFSTLNFAVPFGTIALLVGLKEIIFERNSVGLKTAYKLDVENSQGCSYLQRFGFFDHLGIGADTSPMELKLGNGRFVLIERIQKQHFEFEGVPVQEKLDHFCFHLAKMILREKDQESPQVQAIAWSLREVIRNVFEHAETDDAYVTAQSWVNGNVEIAIGDCGIGICQALSKAYDLKDGRHALEMALLPGITEYTGPETKYKWQNSGFGLYMLSSIAAEYGTFQIGSSNAILQTNQNRSRALPSGFSRGTTVGLSLNIPEDVYWSNLLERTKNIGEERAKHIEGARKKASASSGSPWSPM